MKDDRMSIFRQTTYFLFFLSISCHFCLNAHPGKIKEQIATLFSTVTTTELKIPNPEWSYEFKENEELYHSPIQAVNHNSKEDLTSRYENMVHSPFVDNESQKKITEKLFELSAHSEQITSYIKKNFNLTGEVQNISVYGSYLYNTIDPDDVDLLVIVDGFKDARYHFETTFKNITGVEGNFPKISLLIMDFNTYVKFMGSADPDPSNYPETLALQHFTMAGSWYLTLYGYNLRLDNLADLEEHTKLNYLRKAFLSAKAAGGRLYKSAYSYLAPESDQKRLHKVVSRILITDFLIQKLKNNKAPSKKRYEILYQRIRTLKEGQTEKLQRIEKRVQNLYSKKLLELFILADKFGKIDEVSLYEEE